MTKRVGKASGLGLLAILLLSGLPGRSQMIAMAQQIKPADPTKPAVTRLLSEVLTELKNHYRADILFELKTVEGISVNAKTVNINLSLEQNLDNLLLPMGLKYKKINRTSYTVSVDKNAKAAGRADARFQDGNTSQNSEKDPLTNQNLLSIEQLVPKNIQTQTPADQNVTGTVTDDNGAGLPGVSILIKNTQRGTTTDPNGKYKLDVPNSDAIMVFSFVGYASQEVQVGNRTNLNITLKPDLRALNEVVVVGYGSQKKKDVTGAVSSVSAKAIGEVPVTNAQQALQGRVAGVDVVATGTTPGSGANVRIRGRRSFAAGNEPLYVVDGIPLAGGLNEIPTQDIQSMEVLKDASATSIYGSRGANGVILITTKRGKNGQMELSYDGYYGIAQASGKVRMFQGQEYIDWRRESWRAAGRYNDADPVAADKLAFDQVELEGIAQGRNTDWQDLVLREGQQQSHQLSMTGGNEKNQYSISVGMFGDMGIIKAQDFTRYNMRVNLDHQATKRLKVGTSTLISYSVQNGNTNYQPIDAARLGSPLASPYDANGNLIYYPIPTENLMVNPLFDYQDGVLVREDKRTRIFTSLYAELKLAEGLSFRTIFGPDLQFRRRGEFDGIGSTIVAPIANAKANARLYNYNTFAYTFENILNYTKSFGKHGLNFTGLYSIQKQSDESSDISVRGIPVPSLTFNRLQSAEEVLSRQSSLSQWTISSYMARINYTFNDKYLLTLTGRADGSSRLAVGNKWGLFPSVALGWRISDEGFLRNSKAISELKLRANYGNIGNTGVQPYATQGALADVLYAFGNNAAPGYLTNGAPNPNLKWETTATANIGLDFGFWNNRISGSLEVYQQNTRDLLLNRSLPPSAGTSASGSNNVLQNIGKTSNKGLEFFVSTVNIERKSGFSWTTDFNFFTNKEAIVDLYGDGKDDVGNRWFIGQPLTALFDYKKIGIWQTEEADLATSMGNYLPGQIKIADINGDGKITPDDRTILGSDVPKWTLGLTNRFEYKNFDASFFVFTRQGGMIVSNFLYGQGNGRFNYVKTDYWTPANPTNEFPRPSVAGGERHSGVLSYFDGSFIKVRNIQLGYNFPKKLAEKLRVRSLRIYASVQNPFIIAEYRSKYYGVDPEIGTTPSGNGQERIASMERGIVPSSRMALIGLNLKF